MSINADVLAKLVPAIEAAALDGLIAISPENFTYLTGFSVPSQEPLRWRHAAVLVTAAGEHSVLCVDMEETTVRAALPESTLHVWEEFAENAMEVLAKSIQDAGLADGVVGIELDYLPARDYDRLRDLLPRVSFRAVQDLLGESRRIKTPREIELLRRLSLATDDAIAAGFAQIQVGQTELQLAGNVITRLFENGVQKQRGMVCATGERSHFPNVGPTDRKLRRGDLIRFEVFGVLDGYHAGICRTAVVGEPTAEQQDVWDVLVACRRQALASLRPGASSRAIYDTYNERFSVLPFDPISFVGHGIGVYLHENPYVGRYTDEAIEDGLVLGVEPLVYAHGEFGMQIKDMVHVGEDGATVLSNVMDAERLHRVG